MIKKENYFIQDNLVDISGLVQLGAETAPTPWDKSACGNVEAPGAGMPSTSTSNGQTGSESKKTSDLEEVWLPSNTSGSHRHSGYNLYNFPSALPVSLPLSLPLPPLLGQMKPHPLNEVPALSHGPLQQKRSRPRSERS